MSVNLLTERMEKRVYIFIFPIGVKIAPEKRQKSLFGTDLKHMLFTQDVSFQNQDCDVIKVAPLMNSGGPPFYAAIGPLEWWKISCQMQITEQ